MDKPISMKSARTLCITYNIPINRTLNFWTGLKKGKVYATKCTKCGKLHFPPAADCGECNSSKIEWVELDGEGQIVTFTQVFVKPASFSEKPEYIVAIVRLKEGVKALAWLTGIKREDVKAGMKVKLIAKVFPDKRIAYEFIPA